MPANVSIPRFPAVGIATVVAVPELTRCATDTLLVVYGDGGMNRSPALVVLPAGVARVTGPEPTPEGTVIAREVVEPELTLAFLSEFTVVRSFRYDAAKFVPETVTELPGIPTLGEMPLMAGLVDARTVKLLELDADPSGTVTEIGPVVAPLGTATTI